MERIGIIGYGFVGKACDFGFNIGSNQILAYDKFKPLDPHNLSPNGRGTPLVTLEEAVTDSEFIFVCLPTPFYSDEMRIDLTAMNENVEQITRITDGTDKVVVIKSTVVPTTTRRYQAGHPRTAFCFNPEFLTEGNYLNDFVNADRIIIGADNDQTRRRLIDLYRGRFPTTKLFATDPTSAETVKYMANCFLAMKVIFGNMFYDACENLGCSYGEVKDMVAADRRIGGSHLDVTSNRGFGGKCFPKDMAAFIGLMRERGVDVRLLETVWEMNLGMRENRDWEEIPFAVTAGKRE